MKDHLRINEIKLNMNVIEDGLIYGHANQYSQVILNIIQNAMDSLIENKVHNRKIDINIREEDSKQIVEIEDNGNGVDEEIIQHVFEPHFTTKKKGKGTGIGLYMSKVIIEKNFHGKIHISNKKNGICVSIIIPRNGVEKDAKSKHSVQS